MDLLKELLGFMVLTGPLLLILVWLPIAIWLARKLVKRFEKRSIKLGGGLLIFLLIFLVPFADEIAGRIYLSYLCATEAGVRVYQTVELPAEYWDEEGRMRFLKSNGDIDQVLLEWKFEWHSVSEPYSTTLIKVDRKHWQFRDSDTQNILAERTSFWWHGGWLENFSLAPTRGASCPLLSEQYSGAEYKRRQYEQERKFYSKIFKPVNSKLEIRP